MITALITAFIVVPKFAPMTLAVVAIALIVLVTYNHIYLFKEEYQHMTWVQYAQSSAPYLLLGLVFLFILGFLILLLGRGSSRLSMPRTELPPPETATNFMTEAIGNGLNRFGLGKAAPNRPNNRTRSLVSMSPSLEENTIGSSTLRSALEERLARAV